MIPRNTVQYFYQYTNKSCHTLTNHVHCKLEQHLIAMNVPLKKKPLGMFNLRNSRMNAARYDTITSTKSGVKSVTH